MMEFYNWQTVVDEYHKIHKKDPRLDGLSYDDISKIEKGHMIKAEHLPLGVRWRKVVRLEMEAIWHKCGRPYYNVNPFLVNKLYKTNLDKIPGSMIEIPCGFPVVCFRFAGDLPIIMTDRNGYQSVDMADRKDDPLQARCALFAKIKIPALVDLPEAIKRYSPTSADKELVVLIPDYGLRNKFAGVDTSLVTPIRLEIVGDETVPQAIHRNIAESDKIYAKLLSNNYSRLSNLFSVVISCGFLANTPEDNLGLVIPDVLGKDRISFDEARKNHNQAQLTAITDRAHRRGKLGWNIGTNEMFVGELGPEKREAGEGTGEGRELQYSHIRGGHPHAVRYGEGRIKVKIKWFRSIQVRKDLPFKAE